MNFRLVFKLTGKTLMVAAGAMVLPLLVTLLYHEDPRPFLFTIPVVLLLGLLLSRLKSSDHFFSREGFFAVALIWLLMGALGHATMWLAVFGDVGVCVIAALNAMRAMRIRS